MKTDRNLSTFLFGLVLVLSISSCSFLPSKPSMEEPASISKPSTEEPASPSSLKPNQTVQPVGMPIWVFGNYIRLVCFSDFPLAFGLRLTQ